MGLSHNRGCSNYPKTTWQHEGDDDVDAMMIFLGKIRKYRQACTEKGTRCAPHFRSQTILQTSCDVSPCECFSKQCTSEMSRTLQTSTVYVSRVSYLFECNANDTYVLRMTHVNPCDVNPSGCKKNGSFFSPHFA